MHGRGFKNMPVTVLFEATRIQCNDDDDGNETTRSRHLAAAAAAAASRLR